MDSERSDKKLTLLIKERSAAIGFDLTGIAKPRALMDYEARLKNWVASGMNDKMNYLSRDTAKRADPAQLFPEVRSIIVTGINYYTLNWQSEPGVPLISRYAYGRDYHLVIREKLELLLEYIKSVEPSAEGKIFVDSSPMFEKPWAVEAGLGWQGRHSVVINKEIGSFFFIGLLALNKQLEYDKPFAGNLCGKCRSCIEHCPTSAINNDGTIDARKCISNLTIENRTPLADEIIPLIGNRVYACDKCQEVCPWNKHAKQHKHSAFNIRRELVEMTREEWASLSREKFDELFTGTPVGRVEYERFKSNVDKILNYTF